MIYRIGEDSSKQFWPVIRAGRAEPVWNPEAWSAQMTEMLYPVNASCDSSDPLTIPQREALERALAKMVLMGAQAGVSTDQMIKLLDAGLTVRELVEYVLARAGDVA